MYKRQQEEIVDKGGLIFFAQLNGEIVGTVALLKIAENSYELSKMAVNEKYQGKKIGQKLMQHCITTAKAMKLDSLFLFSNTKLIAAISIYEKYGFKEIPFADENPYERSNIKMELVF